MRTTKFIRLALPVAAALLLSACVGGGGGFFGSTDFQLNFRDTAAFPQLDPVNNVLLIDVSDNVDWLASNPTLKVSIDGTQVYTQTVTQGGRIELTFPPAAWVRVVGEHEVEVTIGSVEHDLPFTWN